MYTIKAPTSYTGMGWGLAFVDGEAKTDNAHIADVVRENGYTVTEEASPASPIKPKTK